MGKKGSKGGCKLRYRQVQQAQFEDLHVGATREYISRPPKTGEKVNPFTRRGGAAATLRTRKKKRNEMQGRSREGLNNFSAHS